MYERINLLISTHGFAFQSWEDRYGKGVWACLSPNEFLLDEIRTYTSAGDVDMVNAADYIETTSWLPFVTGKDFIHSLYELETLLATFLLKCYAKDLCGHILYHRLFKICKKCEERNHIICMIHYLKRLLNYYLIL